jgi:transcriptional regulator with XRE-family HTH domain
VPARSRGKAASALHNALLAQLRRTFEKNGWTIKQGMENAGASEQLYNQWQNGASPKLITVEMMAGKLKMTIHELLGGRETVFTTPQSAEIAASIDDLPEEAREAIARSAQALAIMYRSGAVRPNNQET